MLRSIFVILDNTSNSIKSIQEESIDTFYLNKYEVNNNLKDESNYSNFTKIHNSIYVHNTNTSNIVSNSNGLIMSNQTSFKDNNNYINFDKDNPFNKISIDTLKKSSDLVTKWQNNYNHNDLKLRHNRLYKQTKNSIFKSQTNDIYTTSMKYKMVRTPGCWRPIFMFINRDSNIDAVILRQLINCRTSTYLVLITKDGQVYHKIKNYQYGILYNYSLV